MPTSGSHQAVIRALSHNYIRNELSKYIEHSFIINFIFFKQRKSTIAALYQLPNLKCQENMAMVVALTPVTG